MITVLGHQTTFEELAKITPTTPPGAGGRWRPIPHAELVSAMRYAIDQWGWTIVEARYALARGGADMAGAFLLNVPSVPAPDGLTLALGWMHSNARRHALKLTVGAEVACCTNGLCTGTVLLSRAHDHTVDLKEEIVVALGRYEQAAKLVGSAEAVLRGTPVTREEASYLLIRAGRDRLIGWATVGRVWEEYRHPTHRSHGQDNAWALLNAFTYAARPNIAPTRQMGVYNTFRCMLPGGVTGTDGLVV